MIKYQGISTTGQDPDLARREELAGFLRMSRQRLVPKTNGMRRRTPGLRREEVAEVAGISVTWYTWLEQGRDVKISAHTVGRLAEALQLESEGRKYLHSLARPNEGICPSAGNEPPGSLIETLEGMLPNPAYAFDRVWNVVHWNRSAETLLGAFHLGNPVYSNVLCRLFLDDDWKNSFVDWPAIVRSAVAQFRSATAAFARSPDTLAVVNYLLEHSEDFSLLWSRADIASPANWDKVLRRGNATETWRYTVLRPEGEGRDFTIALYFPA